MVALNILRVVGLAITIGGIALVRRERENAADLDRSVHQRLVALWIAVAIAGAALSTWAILAS